MVGAIIHPENSKCNNFLLYFDKRVSNVNLFLLFFERENLVAQGLHAISGCRSNKCIGFLQKCRSGNISCDRSMLIFKKGFKGGILCSTETVIPSSDTDACDLPETAVLWTLTRPKRNSCAPKRTVSIISIPHTYIPAAKSSSAA